jgi:hypothetical protein
MQVSRVLTFHGKVKSALSYYCRSIYLNFDDSVKVQIDLDWPNPHTRLVGKGRQQLA